MRQLIINILSAIAERSPGFHNFLMDVIDHTETGFLWRGSK